MNTKVKLLITLTCNFCLLNAQIGIGTKEPKATVDIRVDDNLSTNKAINITNSGNSEVFTLYNNGNLSFKGALMPNNNPGQPGQFLISKGSNAAPEWQTISFPAGSKQINELFSIVANSNTTEIPSDTFKKIGFTTKNLDNTNFGVWNPADFTYTVNVAGLYSIVAGCSMYTNSERPLSMGSMRIYTGNTYFEYGTISTQNTDGTLFWDNANGELVTYLNTGDKIWIEAQTIAQWTLSNAFLHIKYVQL